MAIFQTYTVRADDTLSEIAQLHNITLKDLLSLNQITNRSSIEVGQELRIKTISETYHVVSKKTSLAKVATMFGVGVNDIVVANALSSKSKPSTGTQLIIPNNTPKDTASSISPARDIGSLSKKYEVSGGGPGTVSHGRGDHGGVSYGTYQLASKKKRPSEFLKADGKQWLSEFGDTVEGTPEFSKIWKAIAKREPQIFHNAQHAYIKRTHYDKLAAKIKRDTDIDVNTHSRAFQDVVWSIAVQHGPGTGMVSKVLNRLEMDRTGPGFDREAIHAIYAERGKQNASGNLAYFSKSSQAVQKGVAKRYRNELNDALAMLTAQTAVKTITPPVEATVKETNILLQRAQKSLTDDEVRLLVEKYGDLEALNNFLNGEKLLIALRNPTNSKKFLHGRYDDPMLLIQRKHNGSVKINRFMGNTEPAGIYAWGEKSAHKGSTIDLDDDGRNDLGRLRAGTYHFSPRPAGNYQGNKAFQARDVQVAMRDINHDGDFSLVDGDMVDESGAERSMLIHQGGQKFTWSAGCQTMYKKDYNRFLKALGSQTSFSYILINVD